MCSRLIPGVQRFRALLYVDLCGDEWSRTVSLRPSRIIDRLEYVHNCGLLYRDIKSLGSIRDPGFPMGFPESLRPHNFLLGLGAGASADENQTDMRDINRAQTPMILSACLPARRIPAGQNVLHCPDLRKTPRECTS